MKCPLCDSNRNFLRRRFNVAVLSEEWKRGFGFDPFSRIPSAPRELLQWACAVCKLRYYEPQLCGDEQFYNELSTRFSWYYEANKWEFDEAIDLLESAPSVSSLLEVGCGKGYFLEKVAHALDAHGVEFNPDGLRECTNKKLQVSSTPVERLDRTFDVIAAFEVIEHLPNPREFLAAMVDRLNRGGLLILAVPNPKSYLEEADHTLLDMPPHHVTSWGKEPFAYLEGKFPLKLREMRQEPLRYVHYRSYMNDFIRSYQIPGGSSIKARLRRLLSLALRETSESVVDAIVASSYQSGKKALIGQTHLAVFVKT